LGQCPNFAIPTTFKSFRGSDHKIATLDLKHPDFLCFHFFKLPTSALTVENAHDMGECGFKHSNESTILLPSLSKLTSWFQQTCFAYAVDFPSYVQLQDNKGFSCRSNTK